MSRSTKDLHVLGFIYLFCPYVRIYFQLVAFV